MAARDVTINMVYKGQRIKGRGVLSATREQNKLCLYNLPNRFKISINSDSNEHNITHMHTINLSNFFRIKKAKAHGKVVGSVHFIPETMENSIELNSFAKKMYYKYIINFYKKCDYVVSVNPVFIDTLNQKYNIPKEKLVYIPNYVDHNLFTKKTDDEIALIKREFGLPIDQFVVLAVGEISPRKGFLDFVEIAKECPEYQFVWAGTLKYKKHTKNYKAIRKALEEAKETPNIKLLGLVHREKMNDVYNMADILFLPSYEELFPMTILEAYNVNIPVVARDLSYYPQILFGNYIKGQNNKDFIDEINKLATNQQYYKEYAEKSKEGSEYYSEDYVVEKWENFYSRISK